MELEKIKQELLDISNGVSWKSAGYDVLEQRVKAAQKRLKKLAEVLREQHRVLTDARAAQVKKWEFLAESGGVDARFRGMSLPAQVMFMAGRIRLWIG